MDGTTILGEHHEKYYYGELDDSYDIFYYYDENESPIGLNWYGTDYYYYKNILGDILGIMTANGTVVVRYAYDAWGNIISTTGTMANTLGKDNPFRYRGYYYDTETGFYYLNSRYYDPEIGRFLNADDVSYLGAEGNLLGYNLFAYCLNDPVNRTDEGGNLSIANWIKIGVGVVALAGAIALTVATGGGATAVAVGVAKIVSSVALSTATSAGIGYLTNGKEGAIDGACNGFMFGSLSACGGAALKYLSSPKKGIDTYRNLRKINKGTGNQVHHIIEKRFANVLGIDDTKGMLSIALSKDEHQIFTNAWREALPYGNSYSKRQILIAAIKIYAKSPKLLASALKTILR